jgi:LuxR family quorum-sensing system transcriptional regulator CciR
MEIFEFVECSNRTKSLPELFNLLVKAADKEGFGRVAFGALTYHEPVHLAGNAAPAIALNFPSDWTNHYFEHKYYEVDPVVVFTPGIARPFLWAWLEQRHLEPKQQRILHEANEAGLKNGVSVPLHGPWGRVAVVSFASGCEGADPEAKLGRLNALASQFHVAFTDISQGARFANVPVRLSHREKDCLTWTAQGKSSWDIGMILNISENTVNFHVKNAMRKLDTTSRTVAVVKSIRLNLIQLP